MKKILLFVCAVGIAASSVAQQAGLNMRDGIPAKVESFASTKGEKTDVIDWFNYQTDEIAPLSSGQGFFAVLFPDTMVKMNYGGNYAPVNFNSFGQVFDPKGFITSQTVRLDSNDSYTVDSIAIPYRYFRFQTAAPDTLVIHIYKHDVLLNASIVSNGRRFKTGEYDYLTARGTNFTQEIVEILDFDDTAATADFLQYPLSIDVNPGEVMGATFTYLPGNPYSEGDTIFGDTDPVGNPINRFDHFYHADDDQLYYDGFFNSGEVVNASVRYNESQNGWNGLYISGIAFERYINANMNFHVNALDVGIEDAKELGYSVEQNFPNPFSGITTIKYALAQTSNVSIEIFDITGKSVMVINEGFKNVGEYQVDVDGSSLKSGVYYYTFRTDNDQVTKKMMIQR